jgi:ADP-ribosyl-[dinitrogen reductase] hydrolase
MLVEMAVADAYAIGWEFTSIKHQPAPIDLSAFVQHPTYLELKPGQYTDDTQRAIANTNVMLSYSNRMDVYDPLAYARAYVNAYYTDPREGYSRGFQALLKSVATGEGFLEKVTRNKTSNGSVMGVAPLGFLPTLSSVKMAATIQAITTHHPETAIHAQLVALAVHYFIHRKGDRKDLVGWLMMAADWRASSEAEFQWEQQVNLNSRGLGTSIKASSISAYMAYAVTTFDSLTDIIKDAVTRGGDTDSAAAVAVAVASLCPDIENDIPQHLYDALDAANPGFGLDFLNSLESNLRKRYVRG